MFSEKRFSRNLELENYIISRVFRFEYCSFRLLGQVYPDLIHHPSFEQKQYQMHSV